MAGDGLAAFDPVASLLGDLDTITTLAGSSARPPDGGLVPGETRPAAILLVDIVGFTPLAELLGAEALSSLVDRCFRIFELTVQAHGGYCDKLIGDAGLYVFSGHVSYEPPCQGALRSGLEIQRRVAQVNDSLGAAELQIAVRCGVSFGEVTRQQIGGPQQQFTVMGSPVNLSQRLQGAAAPGTVCTVKEVLDETGTLFASEPLGERELKGIGVRELFIVTAERAMPVQLRGRGQISPLVGREELLREAAGVVEGWLCESQSAKSHSPKSGRLLVLRGPTAVGKSRMAWELSKRIAAQHTVAIATAHCTPHSGLLGFAAELCKVAGLRAENVVERWAELCALSCDNTEKNMQHLPLLGYVLGSSVVDTTAIRQGNSAAFSTACKGAMAACLELSVREGKQPLLLVEDVQWLGELSDELTHLLGIELAKPLIVCATARVAADDAALAALVTNDVQRLRIIEVTPLTQVQGATLLAELLPGADLPETLAAELHEKSLGLPYYYEEAARLLLRRGVVAPDGAQSGRFHTVGELDSLPIPDDLRTLILGRLDTLPRQLRDLAQHASVLGRSFELKLLLELEQQVAGLDVGQVHEGLAALQVERVLHPDFGGRTGFQEVDGDVPRAAAEGDRYFFTHILTQEVAYASILGTNKRRLHGAAADILARQIVPGTAAEPERLPMVIEHYEKAGNHHGAFRHSCDLLDRMLDFGRIHTWDKYFARAQNLLTNLESTEGYPQLHARIAFCEALRLMEFGHPALAEKKLKRELKRAKPDLPLHAHYLRRLGALHYIAGRFDLAKRYYRRSLQVARRAMIPQAERRAIAGLGQIALVQHDYSTAKRYYRRARALNRRSGDLNGLAYIEMYSGNLHHMIADYPASQNCFAQAAALFQSLGNRKAASWAIAACGHMMSLQGNQNAGHELIHDAYRQCKENDDLYGLGYCNFFLAFDLRSPATAEQALGFAREAINCFSKLNQKTMLVHSLCVHAHACILNGEAESALSSIRSAEEAAEGCPPAELIMTHCMQSIYWSSLKNSSEARLALQRAVALWEKAQVHPHTEIWIELAKECGGSRILLTFKSE
jgi:class 3 adenylate cyclase/tetratricopeptide (TPR) repeat protein